MDYKIVEMCIEGVSFKKYSKEKFINSFQNEVNKLLNNGYVLAGGISIAHTSGSGSIVHFAQALIK